MERQKLDKIKLEELVQKAKTYHPNPETWEGAAEVIRKSIDLNNKPLYAILDPLTEDLIIYSNARLEKQVQHGEISKVNCPICIGDTTPIILTEKDNDSTSDSRGFINLNKYPYTHPDGIPIFDSYFKPIDGCYAGGSFLAWPTNYHGEIHQLTYREHYSFFKLLADFERSLGTTIIVEGKEEKAFFNIFKNTGIDAGSSLEHGHYQINFTNRLPNSLKKCHEFLIQKGIPFARYLKENSDYNHDLVIGDYNSVLAIAPYNSKKPLELIILPKQDIEKLSDMGDKTLEDLSQASLVISYCLYYLMQEIGKNLAYNINFYTGHIGRMYLHFIPVTQTSAGNEIFGNHCCQLDPISSAKKYKEYTKKMLGVN